VQGVKAYELDGKGNFVNSKIDETESETDWIKPSKFAN
jgi:hypothetical protein